MPMTKTHWMILMALGACGCATGAVAVKSASSPGGTASSVSSETSVAPGPASSIAARSYASPVALPDPTTRPTAPGFGLARGWLNTSRTPSEADLRGRVVVVDFWTSCCINCMQAIPTLAKIEAKHAHDPFLVVGVHTQKFDAEPEIARLRAATIRLGVKHPVAIDGDRGIWESWKVDAWPSVYVLDTHGRVVWKDSGEPDEKELEDVVESALAEGAREGSLAQDAATFVKPEIDPSGPLAFPEKIAAIPGGYAIADSGHDRIVLVDDKGALVATVGGGGGAGFVDGGFDTARFAHPQGITAHGDLLYVADTDNHAVRVIDRKAKTVSTLAGTGTIGHAVLRAGEEVDPRKTELRSPWDLLVVGDTLYVALAGSHQIGAIDLHAEASQDKLRLFAGTGHETRVDGPRLGASFAQPSGLATDGKELFVLDSETSSVRAIDLAPSRGSEPGSGKVRTIVGEALFVWGDVDGDGAHARLQHPVGLAYGDGALWVADTYNNKIKRIDPATGDTKTFAGGTDHAMFFEPAGLVVQSRSSGSTSPTSLLVADTDHDRVVNVTEMTSAPWPIAGLAAPVVR